MISTGRFSNLLCEGACVGTKGIEEEDAGIEEGSTCRR